MEYPKNFEIRQPRWLLVVSLILGTALISAIVVLSVLIGLNKIDKDTVGAGYLAMSCALLSLPIFAFWAYFHDTFIFRDGYFICKRILHKTRRVPVDKIHVAVAIAVRGGVILAFKDKDFNCVLRVTDATLIYNSDEFKYVLAYYNILLTDSSRFLH